MNVHPALTSHPKFRVFRQALGQADALEYLFRLWGHCQVKQLGENWGKVTPDYVEAICDWKGEPGVLFKNLVKEFCGKPGWIKVKASGDVIICGWDEHNTSLINAWRAGRLGGRPKRTQGKPAENPQVNPKRTQGKPAENPIGLDGRGEDGTGLDVTGDKSSLSLEESKVLGPDGGPPTEEKAGLAGTARRSVPTSELAEWPTEKEWLGYCDLIGLPRWKAEREWANQERKRPKWDRIGSWQAHAAFIRKCWEGDGRPAAAPGSAENKKSAGPSRGSEVFTLRSEKVALEEALAVHPANEDSTAYDAQHDGKAAADFRDKKARLRAITGELSRGGGK